MHLYLHIPFCHEICPYCSFYKHQPGGTSQRAFIDALLTELEWWNAQHGAVLAPETIYLGGGTPSLLSLTHLKRLFEGLATHLNLEHCLEITLEANPSTFQLEKATLIKDLGVTRLSLGVQSFDDALLKTLGRDHSAEEAVASYRLLEKVGFDYLNLDLMFCVPGQTLHSWDQTLQRACTLRPSHISAYNLTYEEDTAYFEKYLSGQYQDRPEENESLFLHAEKVLTHHSYEHYETSNYALSGAESQHNRAYWRGRPYIGIGPSAVSCISRKRSQNIADTAEYIKRIQTLGHATQKVELLDYEAWRLERIALELRTKEGLSLEYLRAQPQAVETLIENQLACYDTTAKRLLLTHRGSCLVDSVAEYLA